MDLTTEMVVEVFQQQMLPMVVLLISIRQHLIVKLLLNQHSRIIYKIFPDLSMNLHQLPIM